MSVVQQTSTCFVLLCAELAGLC